jgi:hypothetical protein
MRTLRLLVAGLALTLLLPACNKEPEPQPLDDPGTETIVEKSKRDVTICVVPGPMPDIMSATVKADGKQRVCWKGHGQAYEIYFKTADWPFDEPPTLGPTGEWSGLHAPADSAGDLHTLKGLSPGETKTYEYEIRLPGADAASTPPGAGPEIVGEG